MGDPYQEKRIKRMNRVDSMPADVRGVVQRLSTPAGEA